MVHRFTANIGVDNWSARFTWTIKLSTVGVRKFRANQDNGMRLWIDDQLIVDSWPA